MNKKFLISWLVLFIAWMAGSFVVHGLMLGETYAGLIDSGMFRSEADSQAYFPFMLLGHILMAGAFVWIYQRGQEDKPWMEQGLRFGVAVALFAPIPTYLIYYAVQPTPTDLMVKQIIGDGLLVVILGVLVAFLSKPAAVPSVAPAPD